jgi:hypothetical protein
MIGRLVSALALGLGLACAASAQDKDKGRDKAKADDGYVKVEVKGKLLTGIAAIGGETTGVMITTSKNIAWELDLGKDKDVRARADKLSGKTVVIKGELTIKEGVERGPRTIVKVTELKAAE